MANTTFRAGGLASGLDTSAIIDQLVELKKAPIDKMKATQRAIDVQISSLGALKSKLTAFADALDKLKKEGAAAVRVARAPAAADVTTSVGAVAGRTDLEVSQLSRAAKARSAGFTSGTTVTGGTLSISADGKSFDIAMNDGATLSEVAEAIKKSGAPVTAAVLDDGTKTYLSITRTDTGHVLGADPSTALSITETSTGSAGQPLALAVTATAQNARFSLDGLAFERRTNEVTDALPGATLSLKELTSGPQEIVIADDRAKTKEKLQSIADAYNAIVGDVQGELAIKANTDRNKTLGGESALRFVQSRMQALVSAPSTTGTTGTSGARTLADLGLKSDRTGKLSIDDAVFTRVMKSDPAALERIVGDGLATAARDVAKAFTDSKRGALSVASTTLTEKKKRLDADIEKIDTRAEAYREQLVAQFAAMEKVVSGLKQLGNFLTAQENRASGGKS
jgi:flagellar hook-associated protein 2